MISNAPQGLGISGDFSNECLWNDQCDERVPPAFPKSEEWNFGDYGKSIGVEAITSEVACLSFIV
jgi:hypothetical protein